MALVEGGRGGGGGGVLNTETLGELYVKVAKFLGS